MKIKNFRINQNVASKLASCVLLGSLVASSLTGCSVEVDINSGTDLNRAMVSIGSEYYVFDINGYNRSTRTSTELNLTDGTSLSVHPSDLRMYNGQSEIMKDMEDFASAIPIGSSDEQVEVEGYDRAFVQTGDGVIMLEILGYNRWSETNTELTLIDGTPLSVNPMDLALFNSKSSVMGQIQEQTLSSNNSLTK